MDRWIDTAHTAFVLVGVIAFAASGATLAVQKGMDLVGIAALACVTAVGGGITRDLLIDAPVAALQDPLLLPVALLGAAVVVVSAGRVRLPRRTMLVFDAVGLGVFCVEGAVKAVAFGLNPYAAALAGAVTGVGGGVIRDVLASDVPAVFQIGTRLYVVPALLGAGAASALWASGHSNSITLAVVAAAVSAVRLASLRFRWDARLPRRLERGQPD